MSWLGRFFRKRNRESQLDSELRFHIEQKTAQLTGSGVESAEARRRAMAKFGGVEAIKEDCRESLAVYWLESLLADIRYAIRTLRKSPAFTTIAILTLALGIGANTAIFSVVQGVMLASLPYRQPNRLVVVWENNPSLGHTVGVSYPNFQDWQREAKPFREIAGMGAASYDLTSPGTPERVDALKVSAGFFKTLRVKLALGREFTAQEDRHDGSPAAILSNGLWKSRFAGSTRVLGRSVTLDDMDYTIVGVAPPGFRFFGRHDVFTPLMRNIPSSVNNRAISQIVCVGRLKTGVTIGQAQAEMNVLQNHLDQLYPTADHGLTSLLVPLRRVMVGNVGETLLLLLGAVGLVLLIACANVASLLLARSAARSREFAIRAALGASRARVVRQLLTESVLLSFAGGALGLLIAIFGVRPVLAAVPPTSALQLHEYIGIDATVLLFALGVSIVASVLFGLVPALKTSCPDLESSLREGGRGTTSVHHRAQSGLVVLQIALTMVLIVGAGLLFRTLLRLWDANPGFDPQSIITFRADLSPSEIETPSATRAALRQLIERVRQVPGVQAASIAGVIPFDGADNSVPFWVGPQRPASLAQAPRELEFNVGPDYLRVMRIPLLRGRFFTQQDDTKTAPVVVIDSVLARTFFPHTDPVGKTIHIAHTGPVRIVGVVGHVRYWSLGRPGAAYGDTGLTRNQLYFPIYQSPNKWMFIFDHPRIVVRAPLDSSTLMPAIRKAVYSMSADQPIYDVRTEQELVSESVSPQRFPMVLLGAFAGVALLLACIGIYGVISYSVSQQAHEIGIRMALGAQNRNVFRMVIGQGLRLALAGVAIGVAAALALTHALSSFSRLLYGVTPNDPATFVVVSAVLVGAAVLACYVPARRAMRVDPNVALRHE